MQREEQACLDDPFSLQVALTVCGLSKLLFLGNLNPVFGGDWGGENVSFSS